MAGVGAISVDKMYLLQEWITPLERRLYFTTAHAHFLAGCPALALEVLSKLPDHVQAPENEKKKSFDQLLDGRHSIIAFIRNLTTISIFIQITYLLLEKKKQKISTGLRLSPQ